VLDPARKDENAANLAPSPARPPEPLLSLVASPIGNLRDITLRALDTLRAADAVYAEDTRVSRRLLAAYDIHVPLLRADENSLKSVAPRLIERLQRGERLAYLTDAGMPGVSDPGMYLVRVCREAGLPVEVLPGASAVLTAYVYSGTRARGLYFGGFLPRGEAHVRKALAACALPDTVCIFYESPRRILATLQAVAAALPERTVTVCRELTKLHEQVLSGPPAAVADQLRATFGLPPLGQAAAPAATAAPSTLAAAAQPAPQPAPAPTSDPVTQPKIAALSPKQAAKATKRQQKAESAAIKGEFVLLID
jgi:16S rRNA (cytidine1402-2'-O)-methyltransferase